MVASTKQSKNLLDVKDLCEMFGVSDSTLQRMRDDRQIPFYKIRGRIKFRKEDVEEYLNKNRVEVIKK